MNPRQKPKHEDARGRRRPRMPVDLPAVVGRASHEARVVDLSLLGCLVRSEAALDPGAVVDLRVEMPDGLLRAKAVVADTSIDGDSLPLPDARRRFLAGLEFFGLPPADLFRLRAFLEAEWKRRRGADTAPS